MENIQAYWARVIEKRSGLPTTVWLTSLDVPERGIKGGIVMEVDRAEAAMMLVGKTHRESTAEEIEAYHQANAAAAKAIAESEYKRKQHFSLPKELADLVEAVVKSSQAAVTAASGKGKGKTSAEEKSE